MLGTVYPNMYAGLDREEASRQALLVCTVAAETGQTVLAHAHLSELVKLIGQPGGGTLAAVSISVPDSLGMGLSPGEWLELAFSTDPAETYVYNTLKKGGL